MLIVLGIVIFNMAAWSQSLGNAGTVSGTVVDPNGAVVRGAAVTIQNPVTGYKRTITTDDSGAFRFNDVPFNNYHLSVSATGFALAHQDVNVRSLVAVEAKIALTVGATSGEIDVTDKGDVVENISTTHTDVDKTLIDRLPVRTPGSGLSDVVTLAAPGVVADSNGFFHPLGDHAQSSISLDGQPINDQTSKAFSTQLPLNAIQSLEVITGAPPAEYGDKTSLVIIASTRSGLGQKKPTGSFSTSYGSFGTVTTDGTLGYGGTKWGNFVSFDFERSGRFLDPPEFTALHDQGKSFGVFDRIDYSPNALNTFHLNLGYSRNNFQVPNQFDQQAIGQDQRQKVKSINIAPGYVHVFNASTVLTVNPFYRLDTVNYMPSANPFSDQTQTVSQQRRLNNVGIKVDLAYNKGHHNAKFGVQMSHTFLTEAFQFGITDPAFNPPCFDAAGDPDPGKGPCDNVVTFDNPDFLPLLLPFDLTRGGALFRFNGHTDVKQEAVYAQDTITLNNLSLNLGLRFDNYDGISHGNQVEPRLGASYLVKKTNTVLRGSYSRTFETPYNENLVLSSITGAGGLADGILGGASNQPLAPGTRNQYNLGFQQGIGRYIVVDADYFWKYTQNAYDFNVILNTPITFPISWSKSKLDGVSARVNLANYKGFSAFMVLGHTRARYFPPETGGLFFNSDLPAGPFRIDHDQAFQQTTQVQYQFNQIKKIAPYVAFTWRYDSGLVAGAVTDYATALTFTADQQAQIGLFCGNVFATPTSPITSCSPPDRGALRVRIPADGTEDDDHNPPRITPRNLFDLSIGTDNLFKTEHTRITLRLTGVNLTNKVALYNFQSTFSGTHFVTPRSFQAQLGLVF